MNKKWLKGCGDRPAVVDVVVKEHIVEELPKEVKVWVKERENTGLPRRQVDCQKITVKQSSCGHQLQYQMLEAKVDLRQVLWGLKHPPLL